MPYYPPHSFRSTLARLGERLCETPEEFKALSQNLGHEQVMTTFNSYGEIPEHRQGEIIKNLGKRKDASSLPPEVVEGLKELFNQRNRKSV